MITAGGGRCSVTTADDVVDVAWLTLTAVVDVVWLRLPADAGASQGLNHPMGRSKIILSDSKRPMG